jgi:hypothetical protein
MAPSQKPDGQWHWRAMASNIARPFIDWRMEIEMTDYLMTPDDARKFVSAARRLRDGLDRYGSMMAGLSTASDTVAADCETLAAAAPAEFHALREMLQALGVILQGFGDTVRDNADSVRGCSDEFSKMVHTLELEARKATRS